MGDRRNGSPTISVARRLAVTQGGAGGNTMKRLILCAALAACVAGPAAAANLVKTYSYFRVGGRTLDEIEDQLAKRGPKVKNTGMRHPGATRMSFSTRIGYSEQESSCRVASAVVTVKVQVILPVWRQRRHSDEDVRIFWDTLSSDIKRHEERHAEIAKNHARELEDALKAMGRQKTCQAAAAKAKEITARVLTEHDQAQARFDRIEGINFESRILRLLQYRIERIESGQLPG
jgi:predicted secreted Zn-dependent protease